MTRLPVAINRLFDREGEAAIAACRGSSCEVSAMSIAALDQPGPAGHTLSP